MAGDGAGLAALINGAEHFAAQPTDLREAGLTQREALLQVCDEAVVWRAPDGETYASVPVGGHIEHHAVASRKFRNWMLHRLAQHFVMNDRPASANENAVREARAAVEARTLTSGTLHRALLRVAEHAGAIYVDLGTPDWSAVRSMPAVGRSCPVRQCRSSAEGGPLHSPIRMRQPTSPPSVGCCPTSTTTPSCCS